MVAQSLRMAVPYAGAALGGVWSERSGVVNIALEGVLLSSGLGAVAAAHATGSAWAGVLAGAATGAAIGLVHALLVVRGRVDAIISGIAINLAAVGGTRFFLRAFYDSSSNSPKVAGFRAAHEGFSGSALLVRTLLDPLTITVAAVALVTWLALYQTRFGLRVRASGEDPTAASSVGVAVGTSRVLAVVLGCAICGLGGVALAYDQHQFQSGMSGGRGFIALAAVILSGWRPVRAVLACVAFAALNALEFVLQDEVHVSPYLIQMLPYLATLLALGFVAGRGGASARGRQPAGLGKHPA
jgi:simple sugar transport system permease protein